MFPMFGLGSVPLQTKNYLYLPLVIRAVPVWVEGDLPLYYLAVGG
jgi:hypothetical protein